MIKSRVEKLKGFLSSVTGRLIIIIAGVDPDALGSAFGLAFVVKSLTKLNVQIIFAGKVDFSQNKEIVRAFGLMQRMKPVKEYVYQEGDVFALVDSSSIDDSRIPELCILFEKNKPSLIIDHHLGNVIEENDKNFIWVDTDVASASTLLVELFDGLGLEFPECDKYIPTMLAIGIYSDSKDMKVCSTRDITAYGSMFRFVSCNDLTSLMNYPLPESFFVNRAKAMNSRVEKDGRLIAGLGVTREDCASDIAIIADELIRKEHISFVVVWAIIGNVVRLSARTKDRRFPLDEFLKERFPGSGSKIAPDGHGEGGATIPLMLEGWHSEQTRLLIEEMVAKRLEELIFRD